MFAFTRCLDITVLTRWNADSLARAGRPETQNKQCPKNTQQSSQQLAILYGQDLRIPSVARAVRSVMTQQEDRPMTGTVIVFDIDGILMYHRAAADEGAGQLPSPDWG